MNRFTLLCCGLLIIASNASAERDADADVAEIQSNWLENVQVNPNNTRWPRVENMIVDRRRILHPTPKSTGGLAKSDGSSLVSLATQVSANGTREMIYFLDGSLCLGPWSENVTEIRRAPQPCKSVAEPVFDEILIHFLQRPQGYLANENRTRSNNIFLNSYQVRNRLARLTNGRIPLDTPWRKLGETLDQYIGTQWRNGSFQQPETIVSRRSSELHEEPVRQRYEIGQPISEIPVTQFAPPRSSQREMFTPPPPMPILISKPGAGWFQKVGDWEYPLMISPVGQVMYEIPGQSGQYTAADIGVARELVGIYRNWMNTYGSPYFRMDAENQALLRNAVQYY